MLRTVLPAALALACIMSAAGARPRHVQGQIVSVAHPDCNIVFPCEGVVASLRGEMIARKPGFGAAQKQYRHRHSADRRPNGSRASGLVTVLAAKAAEIQQACGARVISAVRHTYVAGTRRISLHASGKAVDMAGNPGCIYAHLTGWPGGYSTDYARMAHVHISCDPEGGREMGLHFRHHRAGHRLAHRHRRQRLARAQ